MKKDCFRRLLCGLMLILMICLTGCAGEAADTLSFEAMDTVMSLSVYGGADSCARIRDRALTLDAALSAVDADSEIAALNRDGTAALGADALALVKRSLELGDALDGYFDITVYPAVREWGFTTGDYHVPDAQTLDRLAQRIDDSAVKLNGGTVTLPADVMLDLGAAAKGYLADQARAILADAGASGAVLNLGGTILLYGQKPSGEPFRVGIADPESPADYFGYLSLGAGVVATSGGYERYFEKDGKRYIHILDPATAKPVENGVVSVTIIADEGTLADACSTALFVMGADRAAEYYRAHGGFEYLMLTDDGTLYVSEGAADAFTLGEGYDYRIQTIKRG